MNLSRATLRILCLVVLTMPSCGKKDTYGTYEEQQKRQQNAVEALRARGGKLEEKHYQFTRGQGNAWVIDLKGIEVSGEVFDQLSQLGKIGHISELNLSHTNVGDADMGRLNEPSVATFLLKLDLSHTAVSDAGLDQLTNLLFLTELNLTGTKVTAASVERFKQGRAGDQRIMPIFKSPKILR